MLVVTVSQRHLEESDPTRALSPLSELLDSGSILKY